MCQRCIVTPYVCGHSIGYATVTLAVVGNIPRISDPVTHTAHDKKDTITRTPLLSHPSKMHYYTVP